MINYYITPDVLFSNKEFEWLNKEKYLTFVFNTNNYLSKINNQPFNIEAGFYFKPINHNETDKIFLIIVDNNFIIFFTEIAWQQNDIKEYDFKISFYKKEKFIDLSHSKSYKEIIFQSLKQWN